MKGSLLPENATGGGAVMDGDYVIKCRTGMFDYGGTIEAVPALFVTYGDTEQAYSAGKGSALSKDHPDYEFDSISKNSNALQWISSILDAGFPKDKLDADVRVFDGTNVHVEAKAQPKRAGIKDSKEGAVISLITKINSLPGAKAAAGKPVAVPKAPAPKPAASGATTPAPTSAAPAAVEATTTSNGELDMETTLLVQEALAGATDNKLGRMKLGTVLLTTLVRAKNPNQAAIRKMATDAAWLAANAEVGGWTFDNDTVSLAV